MAKKKVAPKASKKAVKKTADKKPKAVKSLGLVKKAHSKTEMLNHIADMTSLKRKEVGHVIESLQEIISAHVKKGGAGEFNFPGLLKIRVVRKPATKARKGINPFTGEPTTFKAKPARNVVKIKALKKLKEMVQ